MKRKVINLSNYTRRARSWACSCRGKQNRLRARLATQWLDVPDDVVGGLVPRARGRCVNVGVTPERAVVPSRARGEEAAGDGPRRRVGGCASSSVRKVASTGKYSFFASVVILASRESRSSPALQPFLRHRVSHRNRLRTTFHQYVQELWQCSDASKTVTPSTPQPAVSVAGCGPHQYAEPQVQRSTPPPQRRPRSSLMIQTASTTRRRSAPTTGPTLGGRLRDRKKSIQGR